MRSCHNVALSSRGRKQDVITRRYSAVPGSNNVQPTFVARRHIRCRTRIAAECVAKNTSVNLSETEIYMFNFTQNLLLALYLQSVVTVARIELKEN
jgi:hypothetical protein